MLIRRTSSEPAANGRPRARKETYSRAALGLGQAARPGLIPDASRTLAGRPDSGPYRQVGQPLATLGSVKLKINWVTAHAAVRSPAGGHSTSPLDRFPYRCFIVTLRALHTQTPR